MPPPQRPKSQTADQPAESRATPVALRLAQRHGIDAELLAGYGTGWSGDQGGCTARYRRG